MHTVHFLYQTKAITKRYFTDFDFLIIFCDDLLFIHFTYLLIYLRDSYIIKATTNRSLGSGLYPLQTTHAVFADGHTDSKHVLP